MKTPREKFKSITIRNCIPLTNTKVSYFLQLRMDEREKLRELAEKITTTPEQVRIYTP